MQLIVGIGLALVAVALVVLAVVGYRRGWLDAARRRPVAAALIGIPVLIVAVLVASYFVAPFFTRTELAEGRPGSTAATADRTVARGEFKGADEVHFGRGTALLIETAPGRHVLRFEDFAVQNGPDLFVYLSPDPTGYTRGALEVGTLRATNGSFNYDLPPGTDVSAFRSAVVWCKQFAVQFAAAPLQAS